VEFKSDSDLNYICGCGEIGKPLFSAGLNLLPTWANRAGPPTHLA
jgi:hypothetical protein